MFIKNCDKIYIHYGNDHFEKREVDLAIKEGFFIKPNKAALWGSPLESKHSWANWCIGEHLQVRKLKKSFKFRLKKNSKILFIRTKKDLDGIWEEFKTNSVVYNHFKKLNSFELFVYFSEGYETPEEKTIDFEKLREYGVDAVEIKFNDFTHSVFCGWNCDSICVLNPDAIEEII